MGVHFSAATHTESDSSGSMGFLLNAITGNMTEQCTGPRFLNQRHENEANNEWEAKNLCFLHVEEGRNVRERQRPRSDA